MYKQIQQEPPYTSLREISGLWKSVFSLISALHFTCLLTLRETSKLNLLLELHLGILELKPCQESENITGNEMIAFSFQGSHFFPEAPDGQQNFKDICLQKLLFWSAEFSFLKTY